MSAQSETVSGRDSNGMVQPSSRDGSDMLMKLSNTFKDKVPPPAAGNGDRLNSPKRDWSSALDLVNEAFEAIRIADERALAAEDYRLQLEQHHQEQLKALESRIAASERRAEAAEARAKDAETWLAKFHDTIVDGFQKTFVAK